MSIARAMEGIPFISRGPVVGAGACRLWAATCATIRKGAGNVGVDAREVKGVGLSGQMHGSVFLDETDGAAARPALDDQRTQPECDWIMETVGERRSSTISNPVFDRIYAGKIVWLRTMSRKLIPKSVKWLLPKDYIDWSDGGICHRSLRCFGNGALQCPQARLGGGAAAAIDIPLEWMPRAFESPEVSGRNLGGSRRLTGLAPGTPVVGGGGESGGRRGWKRDCRDRNRLFDGRASGVVFASAMNRW